MHEQNSEVLIWEGQPSLLASAGTFFFCAALSWLIFPIVVAAYEYFHLRSTRYRVTSERIMISKGILSTTTEELELYRVKDLALDFPLLLRLVSKGNIRIISTDKTTPAITLEGIADADPIKEAIRAAVERLRNKKRRIV